MSEQDKNNNNNQKQPKSFKELLGSSKTEIRNSYIKSMQTKVKEQVDKRLKADEVIDGIVREIEAFKETIPNSLAVEFGGKEWFVPEELKKKLLDAKKVAESINETLTELEEEFDAKIEVYK